MSKNGIQSKMTNNDIQSKMTNNDIPSIVIILILILFFWIFLNNDGIFNNRCNRENSINLNSSRSNYDQYSSNYNLSKMAVII